MSGMQVESTDKDRQTSMQFCVECNNLMYPKEVRDYENPTNSKLVYVCKAKKCHVSTKAKKNCQHADSTMVWKHVVKHQMMDDEIVHADLTQDPTLPRTRDVVCAKCKAREAVYIQHLIGTNEQISLYFICCTCSHTWAEGLKE